MHLPTFVLLLFAFGLGLLFLTYQVEYFIPLILIGIVVLLAWKLIHG